MDCEPAVKEFANLINVVNEDNDFSKFVVGMRNAFKATVWEEKKKEREREREIERWESESKNQQQIIPFQQ